MDWQKNMDRGLTVNNGKNWLGFDSYELMAIMVCMDWQ